MIFLVLYNYSSCQKKKKIDNTMCYRVKPTETESQGAGEKLHFTEFSVSKCTITFNSNSHL